MSYIETTKKEAKKLLALLKDKSREEILYLTDSGKNELNNIFAITKGYKSYEHMVNEWNKPVIQEPEHPIYKFTQNDVLNDIYPEFIEYESNTPQVNKLITHKPVLFIDENITSLGKRDIVLFEEKTNLLNKFIQSVNGILMIAEYESIGNSPMIYKANKFISTSRGLNKNQSQDTIDPLNPLLDNAKNFKELFKYQLSHWLLNHLMKLSTKGMKIKLKSFKGFLNLNYLLQQEDELIQKYLSDIGIKENKEITEDIIRKHIFFSQESLIFGQCMIDYEHCFSEEPSLNIQANTKEDNILITISEDIKHKDYEASKILKNALFTQLYNDVDHTKSPYALVVLNNVNLPNFWTPNLVNTIRTWHYSKAYTFNENFSEIIIHINSRTTHALSLNIKKFILTNNYYYDILDHISKYDSKTIYMKKKLSLTKNQKQKAKIIT